MPEKWVCETVKLWSEVNPNRINRIPATATAVHRNTETVNLSTTRKHIRINHMQTQKSDLRKPENANRAVARAQTNSLSAVPNTFGGCACVEGTLVTQVTFSIR